ncbi:predicted protein [Paecilomyces variotii No. 5]|uniref:Uncharacterized protein n=1 Tax=Byssochlamys spectabilis (strain No. 5 / NBRC 109023) TaxID=1356009 RepID=V5G861_BYSSN|nr:predicted protein [Paecilomyces variotii No. 5]
MRLNTHLLATHIGQGQAICDAEVYRLSLRPFTIPFPESGTLTESPFGLVLTGDRALDYQRVHIRIAAVQAGMYVDIPDGGHLYYSNNNITGLQFGIMRYSKALDEYAKRVWQRGKIVVCPKYLPWGFRREDWNSADKIQQWIDRSAPEDDGHTDTESERRGVSMRQQGQADDMEEPVNFSDWLQDWALEK